ncbi:MAG: acyloxyacyl hydrolase [bacterium]
MKHARPLSTLCALVFVLLFLGAGSIGAEELANPAAADPRGPDSLQAGSWHLRLTGGSMIEHKDDVRLDYGGGGVEYYFTRMLSGVAELVFYNVDQDPGGTTKGWGFNLLANADFYRTRHVTFFIAGGLGIANFVRRVPAPDGTHFNFTEHGNLGARFRLSEDMYFVASAKYMHMSNLNMEGADRNPSYDGFGGFGSLSVRF